MNFRILSLCVIGMLMGGVMRGQCPPANPPAPPDPNNPPAPPAGEGQVKKAVSPPAPVPSATPVPGSAR